MTGTVATDIGGQTAAYEFQYLKNKTHAKLKDIEDFADIRLNIIDEILFAGNFVCRLLLSLESD